jgi:hypothetical protein
MVVKTYKGSILNDEQIRLRLSTIRGKVGYRIQKFQVIFANPQGSSSEAVVQVWKTSQSTFPSLINFGNSDTLAASFASCSTAGDSNPEDITIVFDREIFNQDIYITNNCSSGSTMNYYIELEVIPLDDGGAEYTTLKDMRQRGVS